MKFLLVLSVVLVAFFIWRQNRQDTPPAERPRRAPPGPTAMLACAHCGTHVPEGEALPGRQGHYCCAEHRRQAEGSAP